mgnify:FL=1
MVEKNKLLVEYSNKIFDIPIEKIETNELNPRERFVESEEDELIESILSKGILNPIVVFKRKEDGKYVLLDGERRYRACLKLNIKNIPAHVLVREPNPLENLSMMFHIHNIRKEWTDFAISISLKIVIEEMGKDIHNLKTSDIKELKKVTSLSTYKLKKYLKFYEYDDDVIKIFLDSEKKEKPDKGVDPDILGEMHRPIVQIKNLMPKLIAKYPVKKIIQSCIQKKANNVIETNKEFRLFSKALTAAEKGDIRKDVLEEKIEEFIIKPNISPKDVYASTSKVLYQVKDILKHSENLYVDISDLNIKQTSKDELSELKVKLSKLIKLIQEKILR